MTRCFEVFVILGLLVFQVIPGLDPGIHRQRQARGELNTRCSRARDALTKFGMIRCFEVWIAGSSPAMTKKIKRPAMTKEKKDDKRRKEFL